MNEEITDQQLLTWEECRNLIIELGKFELIDNKYVQFIRFGNKYISPKNKILKLSVERLTSHFPDFISNCERIYHILNNFKDYLNLKCPECGKALQFNGYRKGYSVYCSASCQGRSPLRKQKCKDTYKNKTGFDNPKQNPEVQRKYEITCLERYGYKNASSSPKIRNKVIETLNERYGVSCITHIEGMRERQKESYKRNTGYDYFSQNPVVVDKIKTTCLDKYGVEHPLQNKEVQNKKRNNYIEKTGYSSPFENPEVKEKMKNTWIEKYGVDNPFKSKEIINKRRINNIEKYGSSYPISENPKIPYSKISQELFDAIYDNLSDELKKECYYATCKTAEHSKEFGKKDEENLTYYFYDFTLTELKIIIEFDGEYWHSSEEAKIRDKQKQEFIEKLGFKMIRIKESDFYVNREKIVEYCLSEIKIRLLS